MTHPITPETDSNVNLMYLLGGMNSKIDNIATQQNPYGNHHHG